MGDRGNIVLLFPGSNRIYLYTHHQGARLASFLRAALRRLPRGRWDDTGLLGRLVLDEMSRHEPGAACVSLGLSRTIALDNDELHVDAGRGIVRQVTMDIVIGADGSISDIHERVAHEWTFDEFASPEEPLAVTR